MNDSTKRLLIAGLCVPPLLGVLAWPMVALMSVMMFDSPGSADSPLTNAFMAVIVAYPVPTLAGGYFTYRHLKAKDYPRCWKSLLLVYSGAMAIVLMYLAIDVFCDGKFSCHPGM